MKTFAFLFRRLCFQQNYLKLLRFFGDISNFDHSNDIIIIIIIRTSILPDGSSLSSLSMGRKLFYKEMIKSR